MKQFLTPRGLVVTSSPVLAKRASGSGWRDGFPALPVFARLSPVASHHPLSPAW
ncbi:MAG: hypothetical protein ACFFD4_34860 [Candidatus Odinarchaeota archaeon]